MKTLLYVALLPLVFFLAGCGSTGQLASKSANQGPRIKGFDQVVVLDFHANDMRPAKDAQEKAEREKNTDAGRILFADRIVEQIKETRAFGTVSRKPLAGRVLVVTGSVDVWEPGNVAARAVTGFIGQSQFASTIVLLDGQTGEELARMNGDRNSWPLPIGASTTIVQTVEYFMGEAARNLALELAAMKGARAVNVTVAREQM